MEITEKFTEYEEICQHLQQQIDFYKVEHEGLRKELSLLIEENRLLSKNYQDLLQTKISDAEHEKFENDLTLNYKNQLSALSKEKEIVHELWQNSLKTIDHLEEELKLRENNSEEYIKKSSVEKLKEKQESEIKEIQKQMRLVINQIENKYKSNLDNLEKRIQELKLELLEKDTKLSTLTEKDAEINKLKEKLSNYVSANNKLIDELEKQTEIINKLTIKNEEAKGKVLESVILIENAILERDGAFMREIHYKEEAERLRKTLEQKTKEADEKMKKEAEIITQQYNANLKRLIEDMNKLQAELGEKKLQLELEMKKSAILEEEISKLRKGTETIGDNNTTKLLILDKKLESTFQKLLISERKNLQLAAERKNIQMDLENMSKTFDRESKTYQATKQSLERQVKTLENELTVSNKYVEEYVIKIKELNLRMIEMEEEMNQKFQLKEQMFEEMLTENIKKIEKENTAVQKELEKHLRSEHNLNQRWKIESRKISNMLQSKIKELKSKNTELLDLVLKYNENIKI